MRMADWQLKGEWKPLHARIGAALQEGRQALDARAQGRAQSHDDVTG